MRFFGSFTTLCHEVGRLNPRMSPYIFCRKHGIHIIDVLLNNVSFGMLSDFFSKKSSLSKSVLFVCTKRQFSTIIQNSAFQCNGHFVTRRWLGGMLTNWSTMKLCIEKLNVSDKKLTE